MFKYKAIIIIPLILTSFCLTGCRRSPTSVWDDTRTAGRHMKRGFRSLGGKHGDSRQVTSREEFMCYNEDPTPGFSNEYVQQEYIPLNDDPNFVDFTMADVVARPPKESPGDPGSSIPSIEAFHDPSTNPRHANIFRTIHFAYNSSLIKGEDNMAIVRDIGNYMKQNPRTYLFVEGHCDERGPEAYNLALGSHRGNSVRNLLIADGVNPDNIFTISYGKERPIIMGNDEESWSQNRRAEFKVYER